MKDMIIICRLNRRYT